MDTSNVYVEMCDCPEIQKYTGDDGHGYFRFITGEIIKDDHSVWLPRQDQIQEMMDFTPAQLWHFTEYTREDVYEEDWGQRSLNYDKRYQMYDSMEQLWLAWWMWVKHRKVWDGETWLSG